MNKKYNLCTMFFRIMNFSIKSCPLYLLMYIVVSFLVGVVLAIPLITLDSVFNSITMYYEGSCSFLYVIKETMILCVVLLANPIINGLNTVITWDFRDKMTGKLVGKLNSKCAELEAIKYEDVNIIESINKAKQAGIRIINVPLYIIDAFVVYTLYFIIVSFYLYKINPILLICIIIIFLPPMFSQFYKGNVYDRLEKEIVSDRRESEYYDSYIIKKDNFKETRTLGAFSYFKKNSMKKVKDLNEKIRKASRKTLKIECGMKCITAFGYTLIIVGLIYLVSVDKITIASLGAILASLSNMFGMCAEFIGRNLGYINKNKALVKNYLEVLDMKDGVTRDVNICINPEIEMEKVYFTYPNSDVNVLDDITLKIKKGEVVAIVGENGAGKSTIARIMMGMYKPTKGNVFLDGNNTKDFSQKGLMRNTSAVFQKFQRYKTTLWENITLFKKDKDKYDLYKEKNCIDGILKRVEIDVSDKLFVEGYETVLSKEFGGIDLSGGQWQRVAIARGINKNHNFIVLDEPTAAIDPIQESKIFKMIEEITKDKTAIIITHKLACAKMADRIIVMDKGKIVQDGTHETLIRQEGLYKNMYEAQAQYY